MTSSAALVEVLSVYSESTSRVRAVLRLASQVTRNLRDREGGAIDTLESSTDWQVSVSRGGGGVGFVLLS